MLKSILVKLQKIKELQSGINKSRNRCKHKNHTKVNKANTGNWDRNDDSYWTDCSCSNCGAKWKTTQGINPIILNKWNF